MSVANPKIVDWLGIEKDTGVVVLTIDDDMDWSNEHEHLHALENKINTYLAFIEGGEIYEALEKEIGRRVPASTPIRISILQKFPMPPKGQQFLAHAQSVVKKAGFELVAKTLPGAN